MNKNILVIGAGLAGAVAARELAEAGNIVTVIDKRDHIAGNCYDYIDKETGIRVHKYGPHIWHTNNEEAHNWFSKFTEWEDHKHRVAALYKNKQLPLPLNRETINSALNLDLKDNDAVEAYLEKVRINHDKVENSRQVVEASFGAELTDIFFEPYTKIMWGVSLSELSASVAKRIPMGVTEDPLYFPNDKYQCMPKDGYTAAFEKIFDHPRINVELGTEYESGNIVFDHVFTCQPIDEYYKYEYGELPYRSIKFETNETKFVDFRTPTVNYTGQKPGATRITNWKQYPGCNPNKSKLNLVTVEYPCDYKENNYERYYPVKDVKGEFQKVYNLYKTKAEKNPHVTHIGRMGTYQYLDMWMVICQTLKIIKDFKNSLN